MKTSLLLFALFPAMGCSADLGNPAIPDAALPPWTNQDAGADAGHASTFALADGGTIAADRFATRVVSFAPGDCAGFGLASLPDIVLGPPEGAGDAQGSTDVVSLGHLGTIELSFEQNPIVDDSGPDFVVFENAFFVGANPNRVYGEPGEVSVSDDGVVWKTFPCSAPAAPFDATCAGIRPVYSSRKSGVSPVDYPACGGDAFDLAAVSMSRARFVRIRDIGSQACSADPKLRTTTNGFDLDAVASLHAEH